MIGLRSDAPPVERAMTGPRALTWLYPWRLLPWALALAWLVIPVLRAFTA